MCKAQRHRRKLAVEQDEMHEPALSGVPIVIDDEPMVFWDEDHAETQMKLLRRIDSSYFRYLARRLPEDLDGEDSQNAGVAIRLVYSHALESLFALIGAAVQAPYCPAGWLLKYRYFQLKNIVGWICDGESHAAKKQDRKSLENRVGLKGTGWQEVADVLSFRELDGDQELEEHRVATAKLWRNLARQMLDDDFDQEFMSVKHGFRAGPGPWQFSLGPEDIRGVPPPPERMRQLAFSQHGTTFYRAVKLTSHNFAIEEPRVNWNPAVLATVIPLVANSIDNVLTFLKYSNDDRSDSLGIHLLTQDQVTDAFVDPDIRGSSFRLTWHSKMTADMVPSMTKEDILRAYRHEADTTSPDE
jgi:hypothetical protein